MTLAFLALLGAPYIYIYDISSLRVKCYLKRGAPSWHRTHWYVSCGYSSRRIVTRLLAGSPGFDSWWLQQILIFSSFWDQPASCLMGNGGERGRSFHGCEKLIAPVRLVPRLMMSGSTPQLSHAPPTVPMFVFVARSVSRPRLHY